MIANKYGITVDELKAANNLSSNLLNVGQILKIPKKEEATPSEYEVYTVKVEIVYGLLLQIMG